MDLGLRDRVVLVSGGGSGIGQAITRLLLAEHARVVVVGRQTSDVMAFEQELADAKPESVAFLHTELGDPALCEAAVRFTTQRFGRLDALVNNAGVNDKIGLGEGSPERFAESLRENLVHYYALAHYALPFLKQAKGSIVNVSSKVAVTGQGGTSAYAAAKGAQLALTREWAAELLPFQVRVNAVLPAEVLTPLYKSWLAQQDLIRLSDIEQQVPLHQRMTAPEEIAAAVVFLLSPTQSGHTTAQHVFVDGGYTHLDRALTGLKADHDDTRGGGSAHDRT